MSEPVTAAGKRLVAAAHEGAGSMPLWADGSSLRFEDAQVKALLPSWVAELVAAIEAEAVQAERERLRVAVEGLRRDPFPTVTDTWYLGTRAGFDLAITIVLEILDPEP